MRLIDFVDHGALLWREAECLIEGELALSYRQVVSLTHRIAAALRRDGLVAGDAVAILSPNSAMGFVCMLGLLRADAVLVALNTRNPTNDNAHHAQAAEARWLFFHSSAAEESEKLAAAVSGLRHLVAIDTSTSDRPSLERWLDGTTDAAIASATDAKPSDLWRLSMTGGTTGKPKLVEQPHSSAELQVATVLAVFKHETRPSYLLAAPMTHAAGIFALGYLAMGGRIVILPRVDSGLILEAIERHCVNALFLPPAALNSLLTHARVGEVDYSCLKYFLVGASPVSADKLMEAMKVFGPVMAQGFGQTEASSLLVYMSPEDYQRAAATPDLHYLLKSCGRPTPFVRLAVMDAHGRLLPHGEPGEIVVRSGMLMRGYRNEPEESASVNAHGWHHTGDIGTIDSDGFVTLFDRKRDLIITGGFNVFPSEVEQVLWTHPAVQDCAVVGVPDDKWGEAIKGVVQLKPGCDVSPDELHAWCRERLGGVKAPKSVDIWPSLPRSAVGKVLRREIRQSYWAGQDRQI